MPVQCGRVGLDPTALPMVPTRLPMQWDHVRRDPTALAIQKFAPTLVRALVVWLARIIRECAGSAEASARSRRRFARN